MIDCCHAHHGAQHSSHIADNVRLQHQRALLYIVCPHHSYQLIMTEIPALIVLLYFRQSIEDVGFSILDDISVACMIMGLLYNLARAILVWRRRRLNHEALVASILDLFDTHASRSRSRLDSDGTTTDSDVKPQPEAIQMDTLSFSLPSERSSS